MAESTEVLEELSDDAQEPSESDAILQWPLSYRLTLPAQEQARPGQETQWWHYHLYQNSENQRPIVLYSATRARSEEIAQLFLNEPLLGFDMEWPWESKSARLQEKVGLIQIASETRIGLFHIGLHVGKTTDDIIAPSLRKIIESKDIVKTGVAILNADFSRLEKHFDLKPKAAFELSHLHRLVTYGQEQPKQLTTKLVGLATIVQCHLGLPLLKGKDRTSNWSRSLSKSQKDYAANDAYCAFMLYHCMNAKRSAIDPKPPMPLLEDDYADENAALPRRLLKSLLLQPEEKGGAPILARDFFKKSRNDKNKSQSDTEEQDPNKPAQEACELEKKPRHRKKAPRNANGSADSIPLDENEKKLFELLRQSRKELASTHGLAAYVIAHNTALTELARQQPLDRDGLLLITGIGPGKVEKYGDDWIRIITQFKAEQTTQLLQPSHPETPMPASSQERRGRERSSQAIPAIPQPHTGLSFSMGQVTIDPTEISKNSHSNDSDSDSDTDSSSAFGPPLPTPTRGHDLPSILKRKRTPTPPRTPSLPPPPPAPPALSLPLQIFHNKLVALSKLVTSKLDPRPSDPLISGATLRLLVTQPPRNKAELWVVPDILPFIKACALSKLDLFVSIDKWRAEAESMG